MRKINFLVFLYIIRQNLEIGALKCCLFGRKCLENGTFLQFAKNRGSTRVSYIAQMVRFDEYFKRRGGPTGVFGGSWVSKVQKTAQKRPFWAIFDNFRSFLTIYSAVISN